MLKSSGIHQFLHNSCEFSRNLLRKTKVVQNWGLQLLSLAVTGNNSKEKFLGSLFVSGPEM